MLSAHRALLRGHYCCSTATAVLLRRVTPASLSTAQVSVSRGQPGFVAMEPRGQQEAASPTAKRYKGDGMWVRVAAACYDTSMCIKCP